MAGVGVAGVMGGGGSFAGGGQMDGLTHFAPVSDTLAGEPVEIYPGLGCWQLGAAIDHAGADLAVHGHAYLGTECGQTAGGVPVRNVPHPVLRRPYAIYRLSGRRLCRRE